MRRNLLSLKPVRKPYSELSFPEWVKVSDCKIYTRTLLVPGRHGVVKEFVRWENN